MSFVDAYYSHLPDELYQIFDVDSLADIHVVLPLFSEESIERLGVEVSVEVEARALENQFIAREILELHKHILCVPHQFFVVVVGVSHEHSDGLVHEFEDLALLLADERYHLRIFVLISKHQYVGQDFQQVVAWLHVRFDCQKWPHCQLYPSCELLPAVLQIFHYIHYKPVKLTM